MVINYVIQNNFFFIIFNTIFTELINYKCEYLRKNFVSKNLFLLIYNSTIELIQEKNLILYN